MYFPVKAALIDALDMLELGFSSNETSLEQSGIVAVLLPFFHSCPSIHCESVTPDLVQTHFDEGLLNTLMN